MTRLETKAPERVAWHSLPPADVAAALEAPDQGLTSAAHTERLERFGPNTIEVERHRPAWRRFLDQFNNVLLYVLMAAGVLTGLLGHPVDAGVILGVVIINAVIGYVQENRAEQALAAIRTMLAPTARAWRDGHLVEVKAADLVPGDRVALRAGDRVPADVRLAALEELTVEEAILTGESFPVKKTLASVAADAIAGDRTNMAFAGTLVATGTGTGLVVATGAATELGRISTAMAEVGAPETPLIRQMSAFGRMLTAWLLALAAGMFLFGVFVRGMALDQAFLATVAFAVGAIPEGLPAILTITLAVGVTSMARRKAIIRHLPAVETLGAVTVICSDKTGTLTRNELSIREVVTAERTIDLTEPGAELPADVIRLLTAGILANEAVVREDRPEGNPVDVALCRSAERHGIDCADLRGASPRRQLLPFHSVHKFMAVAIDGQLLLKGAPERLLSMCTEQLRGGERVPIDADYWNEAVERLTRDARRVIALVEAPGFPADMALAPETVLSGDHRLVMLGLVALFDPPRPEAIEAVRLAREAGIRVKLITGDHPGTAAAIAREFAITDHGRIMTGREIEAVDDAALVGAAQETDVFARTTPEHKLRLVKALQSTGARIAMTGDGVNDAPALRAADIGVAMGERGSEAAKEAAAMVLTDDNFATITAAVEEGRTVFENIRKAVIYVLPTSLAEGLAILAAVVVGLALPITPVQVLWVNMVTAVTLSIPLAFERPESAVMHRPPAAFAEPIVTRFLAWRVVFVASVFLAMIFGHFLLALEAGRSLAEAQTIAVNLLVAAEIVYLFNTRVLSGPSATLNGLFGNRIAIGGAVLVLALQMLFTYAPWFQALFGTVAISAADWGTIAWSALVIFVVIETEKLVFRRIRKR